MITEMIVAIVLGSLIGGAVAFILDRGFNRDYYREVRTLKEAIKELDAGDPPDASEIRKKPDLSQVDTDLLWRTHTPVEEEK